MMNMYARRRFFMIAMAAMLFGHNGLFGIEEDMIEPEVEYSVDDIDDVDESAEETMAPVKPMSKATPEMKARREQETVVETKKNETKKKVIENKTSPEAGPTILCAYWGDLNRPASEKRWIDVTVKTQDLVKGAKLEIASGWQAKVKKEVFDDPASGVHKGLIIVADYKNDLYLFHGDEESKVSFPASFKKIAIPKPVEEGKFYVLKATYGNLNMGGSSQEVVDGTRKLNSSLKDGTATIPGGAAAKDAFFGKDPRPGWVKAVFVLYMNKGQLFEDKGFAHAALISQDDADVAIPDSAHMIEMEE
jgi:hypothetical protein